MGVITSLFVGADNPPGVPLIGYNNIATLANVASATATDGFPIGNVANPATHLFWRGAVISGGGEFIDILPAGATVDYIAVAGHNFGSAGIKVAVSDVGASPINDLVGVTTVTDDGPLIIRIPPAVYSQLRLYLLEGSTFPQAAVVYAGRLLVLERGIRVDVTHVPIPYGRRTRIVNGMSESGNFLGRLVLSESRESRAEFFAFTPTFYRNNIDPFLIAAQEFPFFWSWAPTDYPLETGYSWLTADAQPQVSPDHRRIALTLDMAGIA